jgi:succinate dehydrogenase / fumarate reductase, cytochrome b subunit
MWLARILLLNALVLHVWSAITLNKRNDAARPVAYERRDNIQASKPSYMMTLSGVTILAFVLYHLAHYTLGIVDPISFKAAVTVAGVEYHDVYRMVVAGFSQPLNVALYVVANILLGLHLHHSVSSMFQTLGVRVGGYKAMVDKIGPAVAVVVISGNLAIPIAVLAGIVR